MAVIPPSTFQQAAGTYDYRPLTAILQTVASLRMVTGHNRAWVIGRLRRLTSDAAVVAEPVQVDLLLMLAELTMQFDDRSAALQAAERAREIATPLAQRQRLARPLVAALAVSADLAVAAGLARRLRPVRGPVSAPRAPANGPPVPPGKSLMLSASRHPVLDSPVQRSPLAVECLCAP